MTIRLKIILTNIVVFGIILIAVAAVIYERTREAETARIDSRLDAYAVGFITEFEDEWENGEFPDSNEIYSPDNGREENIRVQLIDASGKTLFSRGEMPPLIDTLLRQALDGRSVRQSINIHGHGFRRFVRPVGIDDRTGFVLVLATSTHEMSERLESLTVILIVTLSAALLLAALAVFYITGRAFRPIDRMVRTAEEISASTLHQRLDVSRSHDEVQRLAVALNDMMQRIEDAFNSQRQFVADASHELRTPLTVVYSELEFLRRKIQSQEVDQSVDTALHEINRLAQLVQQLLLLARIDARKLSIEHKPVRLDELLADSVRYQQAGGGSRGVQLLLQIDDVIETTGDPEYLKRAFINVIDNAVKYSPDSGEVAVVLSREGNSAIVTVTDHGPGIEPTEAEMVFKRFYRSPRARHQQDGSGLGLAITRELIEAHGGHIQLDANPSGGTVATIKLPVQPTTLPDRQN